MVVPICLYFSLQTFRSTICKFKDSKIIVSSLGNNSTDNILPVPNVLEEGNFLRKNYPSAAKPWAYNINFQLPIHRLAWKLWSHPIFFSSFPLSLLALCGGSRRTWQRDLLSLVCSAFKQPVQIKWQSGWEMHCRGVIAAAKIFSRSQEEIWVAKGFSNWRKMILTSDIFVMAHKSGIHVENLLLARRRQRDGILITNIFINGCRGMIGRKRIFIPNTCALLIMIDPKVTNGNLPVGREQKRWFLLNILS